MTAQTRGGEYEVVVWDYDAAPDAFEYFTDGVMRMRSWLKVFSCTTAPAGSGRFRFGRRRIFSKGRWGRSMPLALPSFGMASWSLEKE